MRQGAQKAIDLFLAEQRVKIQKEQITLEIEIQKVRQEGKSTVGLEARRDIQARFDKYHLEKAASDKAAELEAFALAKYGCRPHLFYVVP